MKRVCLIILALLFICSPAIAGWDGTGGFNEGLNSSTATKGIGLKQFTVSTLPTYAAADEGALVWVTDGDDAEDTTTGGGSFWVLARWTGSAWVTAGDGQAAGSAEVVDETVGVGGDADTAHAYSKDDIHDYAIISDSDLDGSYADETWLTDYMTEAEFTATIGSGYDEEAELDALFAAKQDASTAATDSELAALQADDLVTLSGVAIGSTNLGTFTGDTISDGSATIKSALQELETAVEAAGAADAFTVKVDAGATAGYLGAANNDGVLRTDGTVVTYTDGGDYVTIGVHAYLADLAGITAAQGDVLYFDGTDWVNLGPGLAGQYLKTGGAAANPSWDDPAGSGDITAVGDAASGAAFTADGTGNVLYFEGSTANAFEIALTGANPAGDVTVTIPATTGTLLLSDGDGSALTSVDAATGDSATAFFDAGTIEHEYGGLEADVSAYDGLVKITGGSTSAVSVTAFAESIFDDADEATFKATVNLEIGVDVLAQQTIGIADDNLLEVDGSPNSGEVAIFTANGLNGNNEAEFKTAFNLEAGVDFEAVDADILRADTADTVTANFTWSGTNTFNGEVTMGADLNLNANEIQSTGDIVLQLGDAAGSNVFEIEDSTGTTVFSVNSDGQISQIAVNDPYQLFDDNDEATEWAFKYSDTNNRLMVGTVTSGDPVNNFTEVGYWHADGMYYAGNMNISTGHTYQINGSQIALTNLSDGLSHAAGHERAGSDEIDGDHLDIDFTPSNYTPATTPAEADNVDDLAAHLQGIDTVLGATGTGTLAGMTDTAITTPAEAQVIIYQSGGTWDNKAVGGDVTIGADGVVAIGADKVDDIHVNWASMTYLGEEGQPTAAAVGLASANLDDADASVEWEDASALDASGALVANSADSGVYVDGSIDAVHLNFTAAPGAGNDNYAVTYDNGSGGFTLVELTGGAETNSLETTVTGIADTEIFIGNGADSGTFAAMSGMGSLANTGALTVTDFALTAAADAGDQDITSIDKLEGLDTGLFMDLGADGVFQVSSDGVYHFDIDSETLIMDSGANQIVFSTDTGVTEIDYSGIAVVTDGVMHGAINVIKHTAATYTNGTTDADEVRGTWHVNSDDDTFALTLTAGAAGDHGCLSNGQGVTAIISVTPPAGDYLVVDGVRGTAATALASSGAAGDKICWVRIDADDIEVTSSNGTWAE
jgi:hypothetical protein